METFRYRLLDRLKQDCKYFLGYGNRQEKYLYAKDAFRHIEYMKFLWRSLPENAKPEWLSMEDIEQFEKEMLPDGSDRSIVYINGCNGIATCSNCGAEIICDSNGDMPDTCQNCSKKFDWWLIQEV